MNFDEKLESLLKDKCGLVRNKTSRVLKYSDFKFWKVIGGIDTKSLLDNEQAATMRFMLKTYPHLGEVKEVFRTNPNSGLWLEEFDIAFISSDITQEVMLLVSPECNLYELTGYSDIMSLLENEFIPDLVKTIDEKCDLIDNLPITNTNSWDSSNRIYYGQSFTNDNLVKSGITISNNFLQQGTTSLKSNHKNFIVTKTDMN